MNYRNDYPKIARRGRVTIVMYHYVRKLADSRYPEIKGLPVDDFREQLGYFRTFYRFVSLEEILAAFDGSYELPSNGALLTFDDGYIDHYENVFPILEKHGIQGWFFPSAKAVLENKVLDANKLHFVLASGARTPNIIERLFSLMKAQRRILSLPDDAYYYEQLAVPGRFDSADVVFIKRMLQRELPQDLRQRIVHDLFMSFVTTDEAAFAEELYMSIEQLRLMSDCGMYIGSHGYDHVWLDTLSDVLQGNELNRSLRFLSLIGAKTKRYVFCYPYGAFNDTLLALLRNRDCGLGLTTKVGIADLGQDDCLLLPRLDTNDFPKDKYSPSCTWTNLIR